MALEYFQDRGEEVSWRAIQLWPILAAAAVFKPEEQGLSAGLISYTEAGRWIGLPAFGLSRPLGIIGMICEHEQLPRLNAIVVKKNSTNVPGSGVILAPENDYSEEQSNVLAYEWFSVGVPDIQYARYVNEATKWGC
ncbi:hypothetical protein [Roseicyclus elongatus]|uniref:hypothetical protein n=1 Tax=Roseicyclus elongatus TaxID=159346 RepID=UPI0012EB6A04|nr:hypothetical protein [Roseibacterium elongatum]